MFHISTSVGIFCIEIKNLVNPMKKIVNVISILALICFALIPFSKVFAAEIDYINKIKERGYLIVGMPPKNNPPYYFKDSPPSVEDSDSMKGNDVDLMRKFADNLGVNVIFDQSSASFNDTVRRAGKGDFDIAIGKLSTNYPRMSNAHPHVYMNFRQALLINRSFLSDFANLPSENLGKSLLDSNMKVGFISNSSYETSAYALMKNAEKKGYSSWEECKKALIKGDVDALYRDTTEIKKIVYQNPNLSIKYVPVLFDDVKDLISIYLSTEANIAMADMVNYYLSEEEIKTDTQVLDEFSDFYKPLISK